MIQTKNLKHLLCAALLAVVLLLAACTNDSGGGDDSSASTTAAETTTVAFPALWGQDGVNYRVIRPDVCADNVSEAAKEITAALKAASGGEVTFTTDFLMPGEEYSTDSFDILVGNTAYPESDEVAGATPYGGYAIKTVGHKIVVFGWSDTATATAVKRMKELISAGGEIPETLDISGSVSEMLDAMPVYDGAVPAFYAAGDKAYQAVIVKSSVDSYSAYLGKLDGIGFERTFTREENGNHFAQYRKDGVGLTAYFTAFNNTVRIIAEPDTNMSDRGSDAASVNKVCDARLTMISRTFSVGNTFRDVPVNSGLMCFVIRLEDGSFIVIDGGVATSGFADGIMKTLRTQAPDPQNIRIAAWVITHTHNDHTGGFNKFSEIWGRQVTLDELICNFPSNDACEADGELNNRKSTLNNLKLYYPNAKFTKIHTGETRNIGGAELEFFYTQEDYYTDKRTLSDTKYWNNTSMIFRVTVAGEKIMFLGDSQVDSNGIAVRMWGKLLKSDICQVAHHGGEGGTSAVYDMIDPEVALFTTSDEAFELYKKDAHNAHLISALHLKEAVNSANRITEFPLPYTPGSYIVTDKGNVFP